MRITASAAALTLGGSLVLGAFTTPAQAAAPADTSGCSTGLGIAGHYGEFVLGDDAHSPDAEGAVAVGGNADFTGGFSVGNELTPAEVAALPSRDALVVAGDVQTGSSYTVVEKGNALLAGAVHGSNPVEAVSGSVGKSGSPIDFPAAFAQLRSLSAQLAAQPATGTSTLASDGGQSVLTLTGTSTAQDVFTVSAAQLQQAKEVRIKVPTGATAIVNVTGAGYDMASAGTSSFSLFDNGTGSYVEDDKTQSANSGATRSKLLWNFPEATSVVKSSTAAWPGTVLAPKAAVDLGSGAPVNGAVYAASLKATGGAETHQFPFTGCVQASAPVAGPSGTPAAPSTAPSAPAAGAPATAPSASASSTGNLATTGGGGDALALTATGVVVLAAGGGIVMAVRRRKARA